jgi:hypothetical protein
MEEYPTTMLLARQCLLKMMHEMQKPGRFCTHGDAPQKPRKPAAVPNMLHKDRRNIAATTQRQRHTREKAPSTPESS